MQLNTEGYFVDIIRFSLMLTVHASAIVIDTTRNIDLTRNEVDMHATYFVNNYPTPSDINSDKRSLRTGFFKQSSKPLVCVTMIKLLPCSWRTSRVAVRILHGTY